MYNFKTKYFKLDKAELRTRIHYVVHDKASKLFLKCNDIS
jgi:hypothetical protein